MIWRYMSEPLPTVSVIIPAKGSPELLVRALKSIDAQTYDNIVEVIVGAGDASSAQAAKELGATIVENPSGRTPVALNLAISKSRGDIIVRCDAHAVLPPEYVERAVETLMRTRADNVGGMQVPVGTSFWERAVAGAMKSAIGSGDARYRLGGEEGPVETVYLGVFRRSAIDRVGGFDERFTRTQDYELNHRLIQSGGTVWFDPGLQVEYRPRGSLWQLTRQYFDYGRAKRQFSRKHPRSLRWRQLAAPGIVTALLLSLLLAPLWRYALLAPTVYIGALLLAGAAHSREDGMGALGVPLALLTMHLAWGVGFLRG